MNRILEPKLQVSYLSLISLIFLQVAFAQRDMTSSSLTTDISFLRAPLRVEEGKWAHADSLVFSGDTNRIKQAIDIYESDMATSDTAVARRLCRTYFNLYDETPDNQKKTRSEPIEKTVKFGKEAVKQNPHSVRAKILVCNG